MIVVEPALAVDADAIEDVEQRCFGADAWSLAGIEAELAGDPDSRHVLVWRHRGDVAAWAAMRVVTGDDAFADVLRVAVDPDHRGTGVGRALLDGLVARAHLHGCGAVMLEVAAGNDHALALYRSTGFVALTTRRRYYADGGDAVAMVLPLVD